MIKHTPVLLKETLDYLAVKRGGIYLDATFGQGGHAREILKKIGPASLGGKLIGLDRDSTNIKQASHSFKDKIEDGQLILIQENFSKIANVLVDLSLTQLDGILFDFGVCTDQILDPRRGFSFQYKAPLDMRMNKDEDLTAARILAEWSGQELQSIFFGAGEKQYAKKITQMIVTIRKKNQLKTTDQLVDLIRQAIPAEQRAIRSKNIATKIFMALRMAVNHELEEIELGLRAAISILKTSGRLVVISFHSLEDALVKRNFLLWSRDCICPKEIPVCRCQHRKLVKILTSKPITPSSQERASNPRARSAKMRSCEKL